MNKTVKEVVKGFALLVAGAVATGCAMVCGSFAINNVYEITSTKKED